MTDLALLQRIKTEATVAREIQRSFDASGLRESAESWDLVACKFERILEDLEDGSL